MQATKGKKGAILCGDNCTIEDFVFIKGSVKLGNNCHIMAGSYFDGSVVGGCDNIFYPNVVIGCPPQDLSYKGSEGIIKIGNGNTFREGTTIHMPSGSGDTIIGNGCYLMAYSHVAHNVRLGDRVVLANSVMLAGYVEVGSGTFISGGVGVHQFVRIGSYVMIGGNSRVVLDIPPFALVEGYEARIRGVNVVGLKRAGFNSSDIQRIKKAYRIIFGAKSIIDGINEVKNNLDIDDNIGELISFIEASINGRRGICRMKAK